MKSPTSSVGRMDELGILIGSATNERSRNTISRTGKKLFGYSIHHGSGESAGRRRAKNSRSASATAPVATVSTNRISAKFIGMESTRAGEWSGSLFADLEDREEGLLRDLDASHRLHPLLAGLLLLEQLALASHVAAVALGEHVLAQRLDGLAGDDLRAYRGLDGDVEHLPRDELAHLGHDLPAAILRVGAVHHHRKRVDALAVDQNVELDHVGGAKFLEFVVERGVAARYRLQPVEEIHHDFGERKLVLEHHLPTDVLHVLLHAALVGAKREHRPDVLLGDQNRRGDDRLADLRDPREIRKLRRILDLHARAVAQDELIDDRRRRRHQLHLIFALEPLLDDVHVQQPEEAAAEAEAERLRHLGLVVQRGVVELELFQRFPQGLVLVRLDRIETGEDRKSVV